MLLEGLPIGLNLVLFLAAAAVVWAAGTRLTVYADALSRATGLQSALVGMLLLGGITSLPEMAVSVTSGMNGVPALAVNNLLGGAALQVVILVIGDALLRRQAISGVVPDPNLILQGAFCLILLCLIIGGITAGDVQLGPVGIWSVAIVAGAIGLIYFASRASGSERWKPVPATERKSVPQSPAAGNTTLATLAGAIAIAGALISVAGFVLAVTGEALSEQTGLGSSWFGALFLGLSTSLPEISTVQKAVRMGMPRLAFSDIFGTNLFDLGLVFVVDLAYAGPPVLNEVGGFSAFAAALCILLTSIYLAGLVERRDQAVGRLGLDSWLVLGAYFGGLAILFQLR